MNKQILLALALWGLAAIAWAQPRAGLQQISASFGAGRSSQAETPSFVLSESDFASVNVGFGYRRFWSDRWSWNAGISFSGSTNSREQNANTPGASSSNDRTRNYFLNAGVNRFYRLNDRWYASVNGGVSFGYLRSRGEDIDQNTGNRFVERERDGYSVNLFAGVSLWYFFHPRWAASAGINLLGARYQLDSSEIREGFPLQPFSRGTTSSWNAELLPSASVGSWFLSVSYQF